MKNHISKIVIFMTAFIHAQSLSGHSPAESEYNLEKGYYFLQSVGTYNRTAWGFISTVEEADSIASVLKAHSVSGIEFHSGYYDPHDIAACVRVAEVFKEYDIDLWLSSGALQKNIHSFNGNTFPSQYRAFSMTPEGSIIEASVYALTAPNKVKAFDSMNPEAVAWFLDRYTEQFLDPLSEYTSGYTFNEDCLYYAKDSGHPNYKRIDYWELPAYSDAVLELWKQYCIDNSITFDGQTVSRFPVHSEDMVANGGGKTRYFPGYNVPAEIPKGTRLADVPRNTGVWAAWDEFVTSQYVNTWIGGIAERVHHVNQHTDGFKGVVYFALHSWSLAYEEVTDPDFIIDSYHKWVPWGTQRGVQLNKISALPEINHVICETYPPIHSNLQGFISTYHDIITTHGKTFGLMLHRDDKWSLGEKDAESDRWDLINTFEPAIVARYPRKRLFPSDQYYDEAEENRFDERMRAYRESGSAVQDACGASKPLTFFLKQNYPNPFNPVTTIHYRVPKATHVLLRVLDLGGREVERLVSEIKAPGAYTVRFAGSELPSGIYFCQMSADNFRSVQKMTLIR